MVTVMETSESASGSPDTASLHASGVIEFMRKKLSDGLDHPEIWKAWPEFLASFPVLGDVFAKGLATGFICDEYEVPVRVAHALSLAHRGQIIAGLECIEPLFPQYSQSALVQGVTFFIQGLANPSDPRYQLEGKLCKRPFSQLNVSDGSSHLCCASWLHTSVGNLSKQPWQEAWNSAEAEAIRTSIFDGSYRFCNKMACPYIQTDALIPAGEVASESTEWHEIVTTRKTKLDKCPEEVNLACDRTCNLKCPSCRSESYSADSATRDRFDVLLDEGILPLLRDAGTVFITDSGDPFASRNLRGFASSLGPEEYTNIRILIMINGMLLGCCADV